MKTIPDAVQRLPSNISCTSCKKQIKVVLTKAWAKRGALFICGYCGNPAMFLNSGGEVRELTPAEREKIPEKLIKQLSKVMQGKRRLFTLMEGLVQIEEEMLGKKEIPLTAVRASQLASSDVDNIEKVGMVISSSQKPEIVTIGGVQFDQYEEATMEEFGERVEEVLGLPKENLIKDVGNFRVWRLRRLPPMVKKQKVVEA